MLEIDFSSQIPRSLDMVQTSCRYLTFPALPDHVGKFYYIIIIYAASLQFLHSVNMGCASAIVFQVRSLYVPTPQWPCLFYAGTGDGIWRDFGEIWA